MHTITDIGPVEYLQKINTQCASKQDRPRCNHRLHCASWAVVFILIGWIPASWAGTVICSKNGTVIPPQGSLQIGDRINCSNQAYGGGDVDSFTVRSATGCPHSFVEVVALGTGNTDTMVENQVQVTFIGSIPSTVTNPNAKNLADGKTNIAYICSGTSVDFRAVADNDPLPVVDVENDPYDPDAIKSKVLVLSFNPILENATDATGNPIGPINVREYISVIAPNVQYEDPLTVAQRYINVTFEASKNLKGSAMARYKIADVLEMDAWPVYWPGYWPSPYLIEQSNDQDFVMRCPSKDASRPCWGIGMVDVERTVRSLGLDQRVMAGEFDEVLWTEYVGSPGENTMFGKGSFNINSWQTIETTSTRAIPNTLASCLHCLTHRVETTLSKMFGTFDNYDTLIPYMYAPLDAVPFAAGPLQDSVTKLPPKFGSTSHAWNRFTMIDKLVDWSTSEYPKWIGAIGLTHFPVDARYNYDYRSGAYHNLPKVQVQSNAADWLMYPNMTCNSSDYSTTGSWPLISCDDYGQPNPGSCTGDDSTRVTDPTNGKLVYIGYQAWMLQHLPHATGINAGITCGVEYALDKGLLNNWWRYIMDVDQFKWGDGRLNQADWTAPKVTISAMDQLINNIGGKTQWVPRPVSIPPAEPSPLPERVHGHVGITVAATDQDPIYRVDLYIDGSYHSTDTIRPYTFHWDASALSGQHKLVAKAYDMPNGRKGMSTEVTVTVDPIGANYTPAFNVYAIAGEVKSGATIAGKIGQTVVLYPYANGDTVTFSAQNLPSGARLSAFGTTLGIFTWTPVAGQNGPQWIRIIGTNPATGDSSSVDVVIAVAQ